MPTRVGLRIKIHSITADSTGSIHKNGREKKFDPKTFFPWHSYMYRPSWICCYMKIGWFFILGPTLVYIALLDKWVHFIPHYGLITIISYQTWVWSCVFYVISVLKMVSALTWMIHSDSSTQSMLNGHFKASLAKVYGRVRKNVKIAPCRFSHQRISTGNPWFLKIHNKPAEVLLKSFDTASDMTLLVASTCGL